LKTSDDVPSAITSPVVELRVTGIRLSRLDGSSAAPTA
jgi:hypothetical protein